VVEAGGAAGRILATERGIAVRCFERLRIFRALALVTGAFVLLVHAAGAQGVSPCAVLDNYERAWGQQDVDGAMAVLADNAVITLHDSRTRTLSSREQIREFLQTTQVRGAPQLTTTRQVDSSTVTWSEHIDGQVLNGPELTVQAVVQDGKIQSLAYRPGKLVRNPDPVIADAPPQMGGNVLAALILLGLGLLSLASAPLQQTSGSNLRGRLMGDLKVWRTAPTH
jgi:hypothetical protein